MSEKTNLSLIDIYKNYGYPAAKKLYKLAKDNGLKVTIKAVDEFLKSQRVAQLYKAKNKNKIENIPITAPWIDNNWQADLIDMQKHARKNHGYAWILVCIDIYSRKAWVEALKKKETKEVAESFEEVFKKGTVPKVLRTDNGTEYQGEVQDVFKKYKIIHITNNIGDHNVLGVVDRFIQTLKNTIYKYFADEDTTNWLDSLEKFVRAYNSTSHTSLCDATPNQVYKHPWDFARCHYENKMKRLNKVEPLKKGDIVRVKLPKSKFDRSYNIKWKEETNIIKDVQGNYYELDDGTKHRINDLQKVMTVDKPKEKSALKKANERAKINRELAKELGPEVRVGEDEMETKAEKVVRPKRNAARDAENLIVARRLLS